MKTGTDIFNRKLINLKAPLTADTCQIRWSKGGAFGNSGSASHMLIGNAVNITISYQQGVTRRRALGVSESGPLAVVYPTMPLGSFSMQRFLAEGTVMDIFGLDGFSSCNGTGQIEVSFSGSGSNIYSSDANCSNIVKPSLRYLMHGVVVTGYNAAAEAEGLTVVDGLTVEFLQLSVDGQSVVST